MSILSAYVKRQVKKRGLVNLLIKVGDLAVKITPNPADNAAWSKIRAYIKKNYKVKKW